MGGELVAALIIFLHLLLVNLSNLSKFVLVVGVLDGGTVLAELGSWRRTFVRA